MSKCSICHKTLTQESGSFFIVPKDEKRRKKWSAICNKQFSSNDRLCVEHFSSSDIIKERNTITLKPTAMPLTDRDEENIENPLRGENLDSSQESIKDNIKERKKQKCRCCTNPSENFIKLDTIIKSTEVKGKKTYKDFLHEITKLNLTSHQEYNMPQQICQKCGNQLKNSYKFVQQACKVSQLYIDEMEQQNSQEDVKNIEHLPEIPIEITQISDSQQMEKELKIEPLDIECNIEIKEEKMETTEVLIPIAELNEESREERDFLNNSNTEEQSSSSSSTSEDEEHDTDDEPESVKDFDIEINDKSLARSCDICHKVYRNQKFLNIHKRYTHMPEEDKRPCPLCSFKTSRSSALKVHVGLVHGKDKVQEYFKPAVNSNKQYACDLCPRSYGRKDSLRKHIKTQHLNKPSQDETDKTVKPSKQKDKERFLCTYCGQSYKSKCGLDSHILAHTGERPFSCDICSKTFRRIKGLQLHRVIHSDEKPHQCSECGKGFKRVDKLKIHMRVHSELRPYKCSECEKTFKYPNVLRTHMHIHTGQTPFACKTCGEAFSLRTSLNNHCLKNGHEK
ncbi:uncharacterized protein ACRADG_013253 [Cochliomyia hominivorax]